MITMYGMNEKIGHISYNDSQNEYTFGKPYSEKMGEMIDEEMRGLIDRAYKKTLQLLRDKQKELELIAQELLDKEVLFKTDLERLIGKRTFDIMKNTPSTTKDKNADKPYEQEDESEDTINKPINDSSVGDLAKEEIAMEKKQKGHSSDSSSNNDQNNTSKKI